MIHVSSVVAEAKEWYSTSALDLAIMVCLLELQEIQLAPRYMQYHVVLRLVVGQLAQFESEKAYKLEELWDKCRKS